MQYEFAADLNRVFARSRFALLIIAVLAIVQLVLFIGFHLFNIPRIGHFGFLTLFANLAQFIALLSLLYQSLVTAKSLRGIIKTDGNDLPSFLLSLDSSRRALASLVVLLVVEVVSSLFRYPSLVACLKLS